MVTARLPQEKRQQKETLQTSGGEQKTILSTAMIIKKIPNPRENVNVITVEYKDNGEEILVNQRKLNEVKQKKVGSSYCATTEHI